MSEQQDTPDKPSCCGCSEIEQKPDMSTEGSQQSSMKELEFAVNMTCQTCADAVLRALDSRPTGDFADVSVRLTEQRVVLSTRLHVETVLELLESTGLRAVLQGAGTASAGMSGRDFAAGVVQIEPATVGEAAAVVRGVVRILQPTDAACVFDGTVDGLRPGRPVNVELREGGDLSGGADTCGPVYCAGDDAQSSPPAGLLGHVTPSSSGRVRFSLTSSRLQLWRLVGRCLSISDTETGTLLGLGIVARSAGLFANNKRLCSCDGVEIWNERDVPSVGAGRTAAAAAIKAQAQNFSPGK